MPTTPILKLPYPAPSDPPDGAAQMQALATALDTSVAPIAQVPVGAVLMWAAAAAPTGWLLMQGQTVTATQYPQLAAVLGQDASGNVLIPDMRDVFPVGAGTTQPLGSTGGAQSVVLTKAQMPVHNHGGATLAGAAPDHLHLGDGSHAFLMNYGTTFLASGSGWGYATRSGNADRSLSHTHGVNNDGSGGSHENRPPYRALNFIIRAG